MPTPLTDADKVLRNDTGKDIASKLNLIAQALGVGVDADQINYDNTESGLTADNAQEAIDEVKDITDDLDEKIDDKTSYESTASGSIATFSDGGNNIPMKSCEVAIVAQQAGTGTPSPSNPRAISGFDIVNVSIVDTNVWDGQYELGVYNQTTGEPETSSVAYRTKNKIKVKPNTSYYLKNSLNGLSIRIFFYTSSVFLTSTVYSISSGGIIFTTPDNCTAINFQCAISGVDLSTTCINYPSTDTQYHAYTGTTHTITLPETIYGGTAELVGGNGSKTYYKFTVTWSDGEGSTDLGNNIRRIFNLPKNAVYPPTENNPQLCDKAPYLANYTNDSCHFYCNANRLNLFLPEGTSESEEITVIYELATPTAFTFTGATIPTLSGVNNVYADSGDVDLKYFNKNADEIADAIRSVTTNKMDKVNPTGSGVFNFDGNAVLAGGLKINCNKDVRGITRFTISKNTSKTVTVSKDGKMVVFLVSVIGDIGVLNSCLFYVAGYATASRCNIVNLSNISGATAFSITATDTTDTIFTFTNSSTTNNAEVALIPLFDNEFTIT